jgi:hypothetical protein
VSVYFAQRRKGGLIKIGYSRNVKPRMQTIRAKAIGAVPGAREVEKKLHKQFAHLRVRGEWFRPDEDLMEYISTRAQKHEPDLTDIQTAIRVPDSWLEDLDKLAEQMSEPGSRHVMRSEVMRMAIRRGIVVLKEEAKKR